ncbi:CoA-disulfide reductase [Brachyspira hampsonii]|uniref:Coenzyme A disulfide reductase n=1 Tax=Brachyspira hampsonii 30446 TaxID=1289135 RepID=A0A2U4F1S7_9SPIR|nr:CoA-disulfide reductase [Brachyspira hampsonii]EKV58232.1 coenzyme A disulfide reductase [Brachyspira hampsonii 30446]MBW5390882.1 CoA-disulfide reductase [Brachyspira hampsonii]MBW5395476.1 CoA-disulfide reductase [Brachyspira hampsonii]OEJ16962.1 CoA-disulfide reductase [Brachyspira hampsonii]
MKKVIIIGGVAAGMSAAAKARRLDKEAVITVYEKTDVVSWGACGMPYYVGGFYESPNTMIARTAEATIKSGIDLKVKHEVLKIDAENKKVLVKDIINNKEFEDNYDSLLIATGAKSIIPNIANINIGNVSTLKEFSDSINMREKMKDSSIKNVVILGAGFIAIEAAHALKHIGKNVTIIQRSDRVFGKKFDKEFSDMVIEHIKENVDLHLNEKVQGLEADSNNNVKAVVTDKGKYDADYVVVAIGVTPNTDLAKNAGIKLMDNGAILVDREGKTNIDSIYAAGDCASIYDKVLNDQTYAALATGANKLGRMVASNLVGGHEKFIGSLTSACILAFELEAARTGITEEEAKKRNINYKTVTVKDLDHTHYYPGYQDLHIKLVYLADSRKIIGGQILGKRGAVLRADVIAACIYAGLTVDELGMLDLCYAPPFARTWDSLNVVGNAAK